MSIDISAVVTQLIDNVEWTGKNSEDNEVNTVLKKDVEPLLDVLISILKNNLNAGRGRSDHSSAKMIRRTTEKILVDIILEQLDDYTMFRLGYEPLKKLGSEDD